MPKGLAAVSGSEAVLEAFIDFDCEVSVVAARGLDGAVADFGTVWNTHANHILDVTVAPSGVGRGRRREARRIAHAVLEALDVVGVLCVEFFLARDGRLLVNELAPRPHNSGHFTFDASVTSQFEQQLRAICGLALGSTELLRPAAMANLLGDLWNAGVPDWQAACRFADVKLHLYGKMEPRAGRKMGHLTALAASAAEARQLVLAARSALAAGRKPMILDTLDQAARYAAVHPLLAGGFAFLTRPDLADLAAGAHEIDGSRVFALVGHDEAAARRARRLEVHRRYIDIQVSLDGRERIGWRALSECREVAEAYDAQRDIAYFADRPTTWLPLARGQFAVFFPADAHAPLAATGTLRKVVIKVEVAAVRC